MRGWVRVDSGKALFYKMPVHPSAGAGRSVTFIQSPRTRSLATREIRVLFVAASVFGEENVPAG